MIIHSFIFLITPVEVMEKDLETLISFTYGSVQDNHGDKKDHVPNLHYPWYKYLL